MSHILTSRERKALDRLSLDHTEFVIKGELPAGIGEQSLNTLVSLGLAELGLGRFGETGWRITPWWVALHVRQDLWGDHDARSRSKLPASSMAMASGIADFILNKAPDKPTVQAARQAQSIHRAGFGQIELDSEQGRVGIYRTDLLRAGVKAPLVGDRFHFSTGVATNGVTVAIGLCSDIGWPTRGIETPCLACGAAAARARAISAVAPDIIAGEKWFSDQLILEAAPLGRACKIRLQTEWNLNTGYAI